VASEEAEAEAEAGGMGVTLSTAEDVEVLVITRRMARRSIIYSTMSSPGLDCSSKTPRPEGGDLKKVEAGLDGRLCLWRLSM
jgi:hypothetical protein